MGLLTKMREMDAERTCFYPHSTATDDTLLCDLNTRRKKSLEVPRKHFFRIFGKYGTEVYFGSINPLINPSNTGFN